MIKWLKKNRNNLGDMGGMKESATRGNMDEFDNHAQEQIQRMQENND